MKTIKDILSDLPKDRRNEIMTAFNSQISYQIPLEDGRFLAVHSQGIKQFVVEQEAGLWSVGRFVKRGENCYQ